MARDLAPWCWATVSVVVLWFGGLALRCEGWWLAGASVAALACGAAAALRRRMRVRTRDDARGAARWRARRDADAGARALAAAGAQHLPWYLVIGAPGAGKSSALAGAGCTETVSAGADAACRWWVGSAAVYIECPSAAPDERVELLRALRRCRRAPAIAGIVAVVSMPDLLAADEAGIARIAEALQGQLGRIARTLDAQAPVWLLLSKCDHLGGFKELAATLGDAERRAACGGTIADVAAIPGRFARVLARVRSWRLIALGGSQGDEQARKLYQFPGQLATAQLWVAGLAQRLGSEPLRGIYFTSALAAAHRQPLLGPIAVGARGTIFLETRRIAPAPAASSSASPAGVFLHQLVTEILPAHRSGARLATWVRRRRMVLRWSAAVGIPMAAAMAAACLAWCAAATVDLAHAARYPLAKVREEAGEAAGALGALETLSPLLDAAIRQTGAERLAETLAGEYFGRIDRILVAPCAQRLARDLDRERAQAGSRPDTRVLEDLLRAYRMLGGELEPDAACLRRALPNRWCEGLSPVAADMARRHLEFLLAHLGGSRSWTVEIDRHLVAQVEHELTESLWLREAYDQVIAAASGGYPIVRRDAVIVGPFRDTLEIGAEFPAVFTQEAWDQSLRTAFAARAADLSGRYRAIGSARPAREIESRLDQRFADEMQRHWMELVATTSLHGVGTLADAPAALAIVAGGQSPFRELIAAVQARGRLRTGIDLSLLRRPERDGWLDATSEAFVDLGKEVERFLAGTEPGRRSADPRRLRELCDAIDSASLKAAAAAKGIDDPTLRAAVIAGVQGMLRSLVGAAGADALSEQDRLWSERVRRPFAESLAGRYPFDLAATEEARPEAFSRLFNPVSGTFWSAVAGIEELRAIHAVGAELLPVSRGYEVMLRRAKDLRQSMFSDNGERICAPFTLALRLREGVRDERALIADQAFDLYDRPDGTGRFLWKEAGDGTARIAVTTVTGQVFATDVAAGPWAIVRLLRAGSPVRRADGTWLCTWSFAAVSVGRGATFNADAVLAGTGFERALAGDLLTDLTCPESLGRRP
jgi:type VI secretion system protein ImpL